MVANPQGVSTQTPADPSPPTEVPRASRGLLVVYVAAFLGVMMATATPAGIGLALRAQQIAPADKAGVLALVLGVGVLFAAVANPLVGHLSDRTTSRFGMRRPWMLGGLVLGVAGTLVIALVPTTTAMLVGWCAAQFGFNAVFATLYAVMADQVAPSQRGSVSGWIGVVQQVGIMSGTWIAALAAGQALIAFLVPAAVAVAVVVPLVVRLPDRRLVRAERPAGEAAPLVARIPLREYRDFAWAWGGRFLIMTGYFLFVNYQLFTLTDHLGLAVAAAAGIVAVNSSISAGIKLLFSPLVGAWSDRLQRRKAFVIASSLTFAVGMTIIGFADGVVQFVVGASVLFLSYSIYLAVDLAMVTEVLPHNAATAGRDMGIFSIANTASQSLAPALAVLVLAVSGQSYPAVFFTSAILMVLGALTVQPIRAVR